MPLTRKHRTAGAHRTHQQRKHAHRTHPHRPRSRTRPPGHARQRRALRREIPAVVGLLLDDEDFAAMTGLGGFPVDDYELYLHQLDRVLRSLHAQGVHTAVTRFDPAAYADYCAATRQAPDARSTRSRYTAEVTTTGPAVTYARQPLRLLRARLARESDRRATWERATDDLANSGPCPDCGRDLAHCTFDHAAETLLRLIEAVGPGTHHVVCSLPVPGEPPLLATADITAAPGGQLDLAESDALVLCTVMAAAAVTGRPGGLVVRTTDADGTDTVRGWSVTDGRLRALTEAEVFNAYCTDATTGEPVPPEPGVRHRAGIPLPPPFGDPGT